MDEMLLLNAQKWYSKSGNFGVTRDNLTATEGEMTRFVRWIALLIALGATSGALAQSVGALEGYCDQGGTNATVSGLKSSNYQQGNVPSCTVSVYFTGTQTLAPIFSAATGTGGVIAVSITAGGSYAVCPTGVTFTGGGGSGAAGTPVCTSGAVSGVQITASGSGYSSAPSVAFTGGMGSGAAGTASLAPPLSNPFTADALGSLLPGHWLFFTSTNTGLDVTGSGGIPPNVYPQTVPLCTDCYPSSQIQVTEAPYLTLQHDSTDVTDQSLMNWWDSPASLSGGSLPAGTSPVTFYTDNIGGWAGTVPTAATLFQPSIVAPVSGQYIVIPFGSCSVTSGSLTDFATSGGSFSGSNAEANQDATVTCIDPVIPSDLTLADVTSVYGVRYGGWTYTSTYGGPQFVYTEFEPSGISLATQENPFPIQQTTSTVLTGTTGSNLASVTVTFTINSSSVFYQGGQYNIPLLGLIVYYTGSPVTQPDYTYFAPPLYYNAGSQTVGLDPGWLANAADVQGVTVSALPALPGITNQTYLVVDSQGGATPCASGGGSQFYLCSVSSAGNTWVGTAIGGGSSITWPTSADLVISNGTNSPAGLAPVNGDCVIGSGGAWIAGSCTGSSGVTSFSGDGILLNNSASTGAVTATLANTGVGYGVWGNIGSSSGAPSYNALSTYPTAAFPTLNQNTTGNAATATNLATYPTLCSGGQFSQGLSSGSNNCATPSGSGFPTGTTGGAAYYTGSSGAISSDVLIDQSSIPLQINAASLPTQMNLTYNSGHAPSGVSGSASIAPDSSGNLDDSENGGSFYRICNSNNYTTVCPSSGGVSLTSPNSTLNLSPSPITGTGTLDINLGNANTWTSVQSFTAGINTGSSSPTACSGAAGGCIALTEGGTAVTPASGVDTLRGDSVHHCIEMSLNDGSENCISSGSGTPGGSNTQVQYNNSSAFGGISGATSNGSTLFTAGGALFYGGIDTQSTNYTVAASDENSLLISTGAGSTITLPQATTSGFGTGAVFNVFLDEPNQTSAITITPTTSTINGNSSQTLYAQQFGMIFSNGTNYFGLFAPGLSRAGQTLNELGTSSAPGISFIDNLSVGFYYNGQSIITPQNLESSEQIVGVGGLCTSVNGYGFLNSGTLIAANSGCGNPGNPSTWVGLGGSYRSYNEIAAPTAFSSGTTTTVYADSTRHELKAATNATSNFGIVHRTEPGQIALTSQTAAISTATLCAASAGACNVAGLYRAEFYVTDTATCTTPGSAAVAIALTFTDAAGTKTAQAVPLDVNGATSLAASMGLGTNTNNANGTVIFQSTGAVIQYATTYTACTTGTGTYNIYAVVTPLE